MATLTVVVLATAAVFVAQRGGPLRALERSYDHFKAQPPPTEGNLNRRLFSFSGDWRQAYWPVAWHEFKANPLLGSGAGTFEQYWLQDRRVALNVRDAHNLYLETLAELGAIGLAFLVAALAIPLWAAWRGRVYPLVPFAFGAYVAYLVHAGLQWDWELPAVTLAALFCAAGLVVATRSHTRGVAGRPVRGVALVLAIALCAGGVIGLVGNVALARSARAVEDEHWRHGAAEAHTAERWAPWSSDPLRWLAAAKLGEGRRRDAIAILHRAVRKDPKNWELWFGLALASRGADRQIALLQASRLNPLSPEIAAFRAEQR